jgi:hypothetical protein
MNASLNTNRSITYLALALIALTATLIIASSQLQADTGTCAGASITLPFVDVPAGNIFFCSIAEAWFSGLTNGTSATTYGPSDAVPREQMAAFITRTQDSALRRGSLQAALDQWARPATIPGTARTAVGDAPFLVQSDGADLWVANNGSGTVSRVRASDGRLLETWTGANEAYGVLVARGLIFVTGSVNPGRLYSIAPSQAPGAVTLVSSSLGANPRGIAYDGSRIWTANGGGSVSIISFPLIGGPTVTTVSTGFNDLIGILYDGANIWVTDAGDDALKKLNADGSIAQSISVSSLPRHPIFDGTNIWVPSASPPGAVTVVRAVGLLAGTVLATLADNQGSGPFTAAFDGQRILVTRFNTSRVSLWKAADLTPIGSLYLGSSTGPFGACSDGINFWIALSDTDQLVRF